MEHKHILSVKITGDETDDQLKNISWMLFCSRHPSEAFALDPEGFWKFFHTRFPETSQEEMIAIINQHRDNL